MVYTNDETIDNILTKAGKLGHYIDLNLALESGIPLLPTIRCQNYGVTGNRMDNPFLNYMGCNEYIRSKDSSFYMLIQKQYADITLAACGVTIEDYVAEANLLGFKSELINDKYDLTIENGSDTRTHEDLIRQYSLDNLNSDDSYMIHIKYDRDKPKLHYYTFCFYRHLYYYENVIIRYFNLYNKISDIQSRFDVLSRCNREGCYSVFICIPMIKPNVQQLIGTNIDNNAFGTHNLLAYTVNPIYSNEAYKKLVTSILNNKDYKVIVHDKPLKGCYKTSVYNLNSYRYIVGVIKLDIKSTNTKELNFVDGYIIPYNSVITVDELNKYIINNKMINMMNKVKKFITVFSRHPSHVVFRKRFKSPFNVVFRLGSLTNPTKKYDIEINKVDAIKNSMNKLKMKRCFNQLGVKTADWYLINADNTITNQTTAKNVSYDDIAYPVVAKHILGSRNTGNYKLDNKEALEAFIASHKGRLNDYIFEKFYNYAKEYRVHVTAKGKFLVWRKLRRAETPTKDRWFFNNANCNWVGETHDLFDAPKQLKDIYNHCTMALNSVGLDIGCCDVRVTSDKAKQQDFVVIEINSAAQQGDRTAEAYCIAIEDLIDTKSKELITNK